MCIAEFLDWTWFSGLLYTVPYWLTGLEITWACHTCNKGHFWQFSKFYALGLLLFTNVCENQGHFAFQHNWICAWSLLIPQSVVSRMIYKSSTYVYILKKVFLCRSNVCSVVHWILSLLWYPLHLCHNSLILKCDPAPLNEALWGKYQNLEL